jgi:phytol kinase
MDLIPISFAAGVVLGILFFAEYGWRKRWLIGEIGRKFVHITVGTFVAFWPFFMDWEDIRVLSLAFFVVVLLSMQLGLFRAINSVLRPTYGEIFFALSVGLLTVVTASKGIYAAAILQMALADGFAAIFGTYFGRENKYHLFGRTKSIVGTLTFFVISISLLVGYAIFSQAGLSWQYVLITAVAATFVENIAALGFDNLFVPMAVGLLLVAAY